VDTLFLHYKIPVIVYGICIASLWHSLDRLLALRLNSVMLHTATPVQADVGLNPDNKS
jgi:hypothetical protein